MEDLKANIFLSKENKIKQKKKVCVTNIAQSVVSISVVYKHMLTVFKNNNFIYYLKLSAFKLKMTEINAFYSA